MLAIKKRRKKDLWYKSIACKQSRLAVGLLESCFLGNRLCLCLPPWADLILLCSVFYKMETKPTLQNSLGCPTPQCKVTIAVTNEGETKGVGEQIAGCRAVHPKSWSLMLFSPQVAAFHAGYSRSPNSCAMVQCFAGCLSVLT